MKVTTRRWAAVGVISAGLALMISVSRESPRLPVFASRPAAAASNSGARDTHAAARHGATPRTAPASGPAALDLRPYAHRTTAGSIARANLDAKITSLTAAVRRERSPSSSLRSLLEGLLTRTQFFGTFSDFDEAKRLVGALETDDRAEHIDAWASLAGAVHDFDGAISAFDRAERMDGVPRITQRTTLNLALGRDLPGVLTARERAVATVANFETLASLGAAQAALGNFDEADATYRRALDAYRDVSPFPVAWVEFQRGMMWAEMAGRPERAVPLYRDAVARLPGYVAATVHLAELEAASGEHDRAVARLRPLAGEVEDPEPSALLSTLLADGDAAEARRLALSAKDRYETLLRKHRKAFLDHAAEFFSGPGNEPSRALALAEENLEHRPTDRAYTVAIRAAVAGRRIARACMLAERAGNDRPSVPLAELRRDVLARCAAPTARR